MLKQFHDIHVTTLRMFAVCVVLRTGQEAIRIERAGKVYLDGLLALNVETIRTPASLLARSGVVSFLSSSICFWQDGQAELHPGPQSACALASSLTKIAHQAFAHCLKDMVLRGRYLADVWCQWIELRL